MIDQLLHSNALSLKLTANPLLADRVWYLTENTCIKAFTANDPQAKKRAHGALFKLYRACWRSRYRRRQKPVPSLALRD